MPCSGLVSSALLPFEGVDSPVHLKRLCKEAFSQYGVVYVVGVKEEVPSFRL